MYKDGLASGAIEYGGKFYNIDGDGMRGDPYEERNGRLGYWVDYTTTTVSGNYLHGQTLSAERSRWVNVNSNGGDGWHPPMAIDGFRKGTNPGFNIDNAVDYLNENAYPKYDKATCGRCARAIRLSLEAGGINTSNHPNSAKEYGPHLTRWGFSTVNQTNYEPLKGDLRVFQNYTGGSIHGHINMYNGNQWVSDFYENGFWPGRGYRENNASFTIYRWGN
jgi:hypothetical protein